MRAHEQARRRVLQNARRGYRLATSDSAYRSRVRERLALDAEPADLWQAVDWTWAAALDIARPEGPLAPEIAAGAALLRQLMEGDDTAAERWSEATRDRLSLGSTLRSHPFAEQSSWSLRKMSRAS